MPSRPAWNGGVARTDLIDHHNPFDPRPLLAIATRLDNPAAHEHENRPLFMPDHEIADLFGVHIRTIVRWRAGEHWLSVQLADRLACTIGLHPVLVWPDFHDVVDRLPAWEPPRWDAWFELEVAVA